MKGKTSLEAATDKKGKKTRWPSLRPQRKNKLEKRLSRGGRKVKEAL